MPANAATADCLRWKKFPVLDDGFVCLVDVMGDDQAVVQAARVSYGEGTRRVSDDRALDPLSAAAPPYHAVRDGRDEVAGPRADGLLAAVDSPPHGHVNEYSTRYSLAIDAAQATPPDAWRRQAASNRQGSEGLLTADVGAELSAAEREFQEQARRTVRRADRAGRCPGAGPQGFAAVDLHRGLLEDRPAQSAALSGAADGQPRPVGDPPVRHDDWRADRAAAVPAGMGSVCRLSTWRRCFSRGWSRG